MATGEALPRGLAPLRRGGFVVHPKLEPGAVPGWFAVAPVRHVEQIDALSPRELHELGPLVAETSAALRAATPCARIYVCVFAEVLKHLHVHVIARPPDLPEDAWGPRLFLQESDDAGSELPVARRVLARLEASSRRPPGSAPLRAALLSGLVCPGVGQLVNGQRVKGVALILLSVAAVALLAFRIATEGLLVLPADPARLDPALILDLAVQVRERSAGAFRIFYWSFGALWIFGVVDAWRGARRHAHS